MFDPSDYVISLFADVIKDKIDEKIEQKELSKLIEIYLSHKQEENYFSDLNSEFDFEGVCNYARKELLEDIKTCVFEDPEQQEQRKTNIIEKAISYASATFSDSKHNVQKMMEDIIDILIYFYGTYKTEKGNLIHFQAIKKDLLDINNKLDVSLKNDEKISNQISRAQAGIEQISRAQDKKTSLRTRLNSMADSKRNALKEYLLFPWFKESPNYSEVFPKLFIKPVFENNKEMNTLTKTDGHVFVLGAAGAGKTTLLRFLFAFENATDRNCMYITAKEAMKKNDFMDVLKEYVSEYAGETELFSVYIDGLDEAFANKFKKLRSFMRELQYYRNVQFWIGCRQDFYEHFYNEDFAGIKNTFIIKPWEIEEQAERFIKTYQEIVGCDELDKHINELVSANETIQAFKTNPFQLSLLVYLAENNELEQIKGVYSLYESFINTWIEQEKKRGTSSMSKSEIVNVLTDAAVSIYNGLDYKLTEELVHISAVRNILVIQEKAKLSSVLYVTDFHHRSLATFLIAYKLVQAFLENESKTIRDLFKVKLKDDVTNFVGNKFAMMDESEKNRVKHTLMELYNDVQDDDISIKEQIIYYITRLGTDVSDFLKKLVQDPPKHSLMRLSLAYGCVLSDKPDVRHFALDYAKSISRETKDAATNRAWTIIYFGDVNDRDPYSYEDDEQRPWENARKARIKRFTKQNPRLKDYRFRLFDIPLFHSFLKNREWNNISESEFDILKRVEFPDDIFTQEEIAFLREEKMKLLDEYEKRLKNQKKES